MNPFDRSMPLSGRLLLFLGVLLGGFPWGACQSAPKERVATSRPHLETARRISRPGLRLYSPLPSPDGKWVAASGHLGRGLYVMPADGSGPPIPVARDYRGPKAWQAGALHFGHHRILAWHPDGHTSPGRATWRELWDEDLGELLAGNELGSLFFHPKEGTLTWLTRDGRRVVRGQGLAWGAAAPPRGRFAAWSSGPFEEARLHVWEPATDRTWELGRGLHPAWSPDGSRLVFARPTEFTRTGSLLGVRRSRLWLWTPGSARPVPLDVQGGSAPMEPVFGPEGRFVYCSDWLDGTIYRLDLGGRP